MNTEIVRSALAALGPDRVRQGMRAFDDASPVGSWRRCFWAFCYGPPDWLLDRMVGTVDGDPAEWATWERRRNYAARILGVTRKQLDHITTMFDCETTRAELHALCLTWLAEQEIGQSSNCKDADGTRCSEPAEMRGNDGHACPQSDHDAIERVIAESAAEEVCCG